MKMVPVKTKHRINYSNRCAEKRKNSKKRCNQARHEKLPGGRGVVRGDNERAVADGSQARSVYLALLRAGLLNCVFSGLPFGFLTFCPLSVNSMQPYFDPY